MGDYVLCVNTTELCGLSEGRVQQVLRLLPRGLVKLVVSTRPPPPSAAQGKLQSLRNYTLTLLSIVKLELDSRLHVCVCKVLSINNCYCGSYIILRIKWGFQLSVDILGYYRTASQSFYISQ